MRWVHITEAKRSLDDYTKLGLDAVAANNYLSAGIPPRLAVDYQRASEKYNLTFADILSGHKDRVRRTRQDRAYTRLVASLGELAQASTAITHEQACALVANDDDMFDSINMHISGDPDWFETSSQDAQRLFALIKRIRPFKHPPLYRGECGYHTSHSRTFHSWTVARDSADYFWKDCGRGNGRLLRLTVPVQAIDLGLVGLWRGRLKQESHYMGSQGEWLVPDGYPRQVIAQC